jgi:hypothetical protein
MYPRTQSANMASYMWLCDTLLLTLLGHRIIRPDDIGNEPKLWKAYVFPLLRSLIGGVTTLTGNISGRATAAAPL